MRTQPSGCKNSPFAGAKSPSSPSPAPDPATTSQYRIHFFACSSRSRNRPGALLMQLVKPASCLADPSHTGCQASNAKLQAVGSLPHQDYISQQGLASEHAPREQHLSEAVVPGGIPGWPAKRRASIAAHSDSASSSHFLTPLLLASAPLSPISLPPVVFTSLTQTSCESAQQTLEK